MTQHALQASVRVRRGSFELDADLTVARGEIVALLGPNGAGKSTLLNALSGLIRPDHARVSVFDRSLDETGPSGSLTQAAPEHRRIGLLSQDPLLFPHLTALENVAFGRRAQGLTPGEARRDALEWLDAVGLADYADRRPAALSGGQQQRVAVARALAARPDVLLLDEPLAALDVQTAAEVRRMLLDRLRTDGTTAVIVTHDALDAITLATRCAIMADGRIIDDGPMQRVLGHPQTAFIAAIAGMNWVAGVSDGAGGIVHRSGWRLNGRTLGAPLDAGAPACATFSPSAVRLETAVAPPDEALGGILASVEPSTGGIRLRIREHDGTPVDVPPARVVELGLRAGDRVAVRVGADDVTVQAADSPPTTGRY